MVAVVLVGGKEACSDQVALRLGGVGACFPFLGLLCCCRVQDRCRVSLCTLFQLGKISLQPLGKPPFPPPPGRFIQPSPRLCLGRGTKQNASGRLQIAGAPGLPLAGLGARVAGRACKRAAGARRMPTGAARGLGFLRVLRLLPCSACGPTAQSDRAQLGHPQLV